MEERVLKFLQLDLEVILLLCQDRLQEGERREEGRGRGRGGEKRGGEEGGGGEGERREKREEERREWMRRGGEVERRDERKEGKRRKGERERGGKEEKERKTREYVQTLVQCIPPSPLGHQCYPTFCCSRSGLSVATTSARSWSSRPSRVTVKLMRQACACISGL